MLLCLSRFVGLISCVKFTITVCHTPKCSDIGKHGDKYHATGKPPKRSRDSCKNSRQSRNHNTFRALHKTNLTLKAKSLSASSHITHHHAAYHGSESNNTHPEPAFILKKHKNNAEKRHQLTVSVKS